MIRFTDTFRLSARALLGAPLRAGLLLLAMTIGVGSVVVLTALGDGARRYVVEQFAGLGANLLIVLPGRNETSGGAPPLVGGTPRDLTLSDALSLLQAPQVRRVAPIVVGSAPVSRNNLEREVTVLGSTAALLPVRNLQLQRGAFLPAGDPARGQGVVVLGHKLKAALFGAQTAMGAWVRIHDRRFRVIGLLAPQGQSLGMDTGDLAVISVADAQALFDTEALFRVLVQARGRTSVGHAKEQVKRILGKRHDGEEDVTVITQDALLATFDGIFEALTYTVGGIAAISLGVAGILIMNVMLVAVSQRCREIGLMKAVGGSRGQILGLFLMEAAMLTLAGALLGLLLAFIGVWALDQLLPALPLQIPWWSVGAVVGVSTVTGLLFGVMPARRAAALDPVAALTGR